MTENPMDQVRKICERLNDEAAKIGLHLQQIAVVPHAEGVEAPDFLQCVFIVTPDVVMDEKDVEQKQFDDVFADIAKNFAVDTEREKREETKKNAADDIKKWLEEM